MQPRRERIYQLKQASLKLASPECELAANVITRWEKLSTEIQARSGRLQAAVEALENYQAMYDTEALWVTQTEELLTSDEVRRISGEVSESKLQRLSAFFSDVRKHGKNIETVVSQGNEYVFDSQVPTRNLLSFISQDIH
jgi:hypothetical protein